MKVAINQWLDHIYAAWLGKNIGVRYGAPIENWHHQAIYTMYGFKSTYPSAYHPYFASDDDLNGPYYFTRILDHYPLGEFTAKDFGEYLVDCICDHKGFFWWGGYDISSEECGYTNLIHGIAAPQSGAALTNGTMLANQIGGQIFIDGWGYVAMGNADMAMQLAGKAASAMHDQNGIEGAKFVAGCIAHAPYASSIENLIITIRKKLDDTYDYGKAIDTVMKYYHDHPNDPQNCLTWLLDEYGYDHYEGACHIIPNSMLMIYALLYGQGDFSKTIRLCNNAGYDTDCNVGNVGSIIGSFVGLRGIDPFWIEPLNDTLIASGSNGHANLSSIASDALWFYHAHCQLMHHDEQLFDRDSHHIRFELPYQTHGITCDTARYQATCFNQVEGKGVWGLMDVNPATQVHLFYPTLVLPTDLYDARYNPQFTSHVYPGQSFTFKVDTVPTGVEQVALYWQGVDGTNHYGNWSTPCSNMVLTMAIPSDQGLVHGIGLALRTSSRQLGTSVILDSILIDGKPCFTRYFNASENLDYGLDFGLEPHRGLLDLIIQKGSATIDNDRLHLAAETTISSGDPQTDMDRFEVVLESEHPLDISLTFSDQFVGHKNMVLLTNHQVEIRDANGLTTIEHEFTQTFKNVVLICRHDDKMELVLNGEVVPLPQKLLAGRYELTVHSYPVNIRAIGINTTIHS